MDLFASLFREHRLILRMAARLELEFDTLRAGGAPDLDLLDTAADISLVLLDESHHAKEEKILFAALGRKPITLEHRQMMDEFITQHRESRVMAERLKDLHDACRRAEPGALPELLRNLHAAVAFYRTHVAREETYFFPAAINYLEPPEQDSLREDFADFDRDFLYNKYTRLLDRFS